MKFVVKWFSQIRVLQFFVRVRPLVIAIEEKTFRKTVLVVLKEEGIYKILKKIVVRSGQT